MNPDNNRTRSIPHAALAAGFLAFVLVMTTQGPYGMSWDEGYYFPPYMDVAGWVGTLLSEPVTALSHDGIVSGWGSIRELPPVTKWIGAFMVALAPGQGIARLYVVRMAWAAMFAATVALLFLLARRRAGTPAAIAAAIAYALHPRIFGHAHFAASETPFVFLAALTLLAADGDLSTWNRRVALAVCATLALATKVNGLILVFALALWLLARPLLLGGDEQTRKAHWRDTLVTLALVVFASPLGALAIWPWMWHDTAARLAEYGQFVAGHPHYGVWYLGEKWVLPPGNELPVPWHYPAVMLLVTSPLAWLALVASGAIAVFRTAWKDRRFDPFWLLVLLMALGPLGASTLPGSPKYDGLRLFLPAMLPLTLLGTEALTFVPEKTRFRAALSFAAVMALSAAPFLGNGLGYHNSLTRILTRDGHDFPFETTYWGESATPGVFADMEEILGPRARIRPLALHGSVFEIQREWGVVPDGFTFDDPPPYDAHLLQNRKGFWSRTEWWFAANREPIAVWPEGSRNPRLILFDGRPPGVTSLPPDRRPD